MARYLTEFIGTFFLVLTIGLTVLSGSVLAPLAIGLSLMVMVYMGGHISGAHYNPAISLALLLRGKLPARDCLPYLLFQVLGAITAAWIVYVVKGQTFAPAVGDGVAPTMALLMELLYTFALGLVVLNSTAAKGYRGELLLRVGDRVDHHPDPNRVRPLPVAWSITGVLVSQFSPGKLVQQGTGQGMLSPEWTGQQQQTCSD